MRLDLNEFEGQVLMELLDTAHTQKLHELHHTHAAEYKTLLRLRLDAIEAMRLRVTQHAAAHATVQ